MKVLECNNLEIAETDAGALARALVRRNALFPSTILARYGNARDALHKDNIAERTLRRNRFHRAR